MSSVFALRTSLPLLLLSFCLGCSGEGSPANVGNDGKTGEDGTDQDDSGLPPELTRVSKEDGARYASLVVTGDGVLHQVWTESGAGPGKVLHARSTNAGGSWSEPEDISDRDGDPYGAGFGTALASSDGRLYALWKDDTDSTSDKVSGGIYPGTLVYRCYEQGSWGPLVQLGTTGQVYSWFAAVGPEGAAHVVWNEPLADAPAWQAGTIQQAQLGPSSPSATLALYQSPEVIVEDYGSPQRDGFEGLRGYIAADGRARFVAERMVAGGRSTDPAEIVRFDGTALSTLFPTHTFLESFPHFGDSAPALMLDASGKEHVIVHDFESNPPRLLDYIVNGPAQPTVILRPETDTGDVRNFALWPAVNGGALLIAPVAASAGDTYDAQLLSFDGAEWGPARNITQNELRWELFSKQTSKNTEVTTLSVFSAKYGAAARDPSGKLHVALVNMEVQSVSRDSEDDFGEDSFFASSSKTLVFHTKP